MKVHLRLHNIQGNVTPGFRKDHQALVFIWLRGASSGRRWLAERIPDVSTSEEVALFNALFKAIRRRRPGAELDVARATWLNLALSSEGLRLLAGDESLRGLCPAFVQGLHRRAALLGDGDDLSHWVVGGSLDHEPHVVLLVAADARSDFDREVARQVERLRPVQACPPLVLEGHTLPDGREHFGYRDDLSQPDRVDLLRGWEDGPDVIRPGEFVLGYPREDEREALPEPPWTRDGSYVVFRRLEQHVAAFRRMEQHQVGPKAPVPRAVLASKVVGRWPSGALLGDESADPAYGLSKSAIEASAHSDWSALIDDPAGERIPLFSHIRKANPRDIQVADARRHRIIRRGVPYGDPLPAGQVEEDGASRGLLFLAYQSCIERQFEHIQRRWLNCADFPPSQAPPTGPDPLAGQPGDDRTVWLRLSSGEGWAVTLDQFVSVTGGGYYFAPSIEALTRIARREPLR